MVQTPDRPAGPQGSGATITNAGSKKVKWGYGTIEILKDGRIVLPTGQIVKGRFNGQKNRIEIAGGEFLTFEDGQVVRNTPKRKNRPVDKQTYVKNPYKPGEKISPVTGKPEGAKAAPARPAPTVNTPPRGQTTKPATKPVASTRPATPARPAAPARPVAAAPARPAATPAPAARPAAGAPAPAARPAGAAPAAAPTSAPAAAKPNQAAVDAKVRAMFGDVAAFLTDPELGPLLRKAASEGWDNTRLMGALQQTKFWRTKGDSERKWLILNKLDNATAKEQVKAQMQAITDLARAEGVTLSGLQIHDLAVNVLKYGWNGAQVRENVFKAVPAAGLTTSVTQKYGYLAAFMAHPEVGPLLQRGAREGWDAARLEAELTKTNWWKTTSDSQRRYNAAKAQDPTSAQQAVAQRTSEIQTTANGLGIRMDPARLKEIAESSLTFGWNDTQVRQALAAEYDYQGSEFGFAGQTSRQVKQLAADYLVPMSEQAMEKWTEDIVAGRIDEEGFRSYVSEQAKSQFPSLVAAIDRGVTVRQYADPYVQIAARELEMNPESIDLNDPKWRNMLDTKDEKGQRVSMTLSEAQSYARKQPEWQQTRGANERAAAVTERILNTFGVVA